MKRKGDLIFWEISDLETTKEELIRLGFEGFVPRNNFRSALIKALRIVTRGNEKLYRRFNDKPESVQVGIFAEHVDGEDIALEKELVISLNKETGLLAANNSGDLFERIQGHYRHESRHIDGDQFRKMVLRIVREECYGVAMKKNGGIYFIDSRFDETRVRLHKAFDAFPQAKLHSVPIYDDVGTLDALETATSEDIFGNIEEIIRELQEKAEAPETMTKKILENRKEEAEKILEKIKIHETSLRDKADSVRSRLDGVQKALAKITGKVEDGILDPDDFAAVLEGLVIRK